MTLRPPVVAICGATGTGKSKLAVDIALAFKGEVINADAVQLYKGLDIATNKVTKAEMRGVQHHLLGFLDPRDGFNFNVHRFRKECWRLIDEMRNHCEPSTWRMPILAGGTHYYIEAVLWEDFLRKDAKHFSGTDSDEAEIDGVFISKKKKKEHKSETNALANPLQHTWPKEILRKLPNDPKDYYAYLRNLNPTVAKNLHPNDIRKLQHAILSILATGECAIFPPLVPVIPNTASLDDLAKPPNRSYSPRFTDQQSVIIWLDCDSSVLKPRLDVRVTAMIERGLFDELDRFLAAASVSLFSENEDACSDASRLDAVFSLANDGLLPSMGVEHWCRGILQTIGFKEFEHYLRLPKGARETEHGRLILMEAVQRMQIATKQYARRQTRWIVNRFLHRPVRGGIPVYRLDVTKVLKADETGCEDRIESLWNSEILQPALRIVAEYLPENRRPCFICPGDRILPEAFVSPKASENLPVASNTPELSTPPYVCAACQGRIFVTPDQWHAHLHSRVHKAHLNWLKKAAAVTPTRTEATNP